MGAVIVGAYEHPCRVIPDTTVPQLIAQVAYGALADAGLTPDRVDGFCYAGMHQGINAVSMADHLGLGSLAIVDSTDTGGASPVSQIGHAARMIAAGTCSVVLVAMGGLPRSRPFANTLAVPQRGVEEPFGLSLPASYALVARRHMHEFGTSSAQLAEVRVAASIHASHNPNALLKNAVTVEEVLESPMISDPLRRLDCCVTTDGGGAVAVVSDAVARSLQRRGVHVLGHAETLSTPGTMGLDLVTTGAAVSGPRAFEEAGLSPADVDVVSIYDSFTITSLVSIEDLGFCEKGQGGAFVAEGNLRADGGRLPFNTDGGGLCNNHPDRRGGMARTLEAVRQLRCEATPAVQLDCEIGLVQAQGHSLGTRSASATLILGREDVR